MGLITEATELSLPSIEEAKEDSSFKEKTKKVGVRIMKTEIEISTFQKYHENFAIFGMYKSETSNTLHNIFFFIKARP